MPTTETEPSSSPLPAPPRSRKGDISDRAAVALLIALLAGSTLLALLHAENFFLRDDMQDQYLGGYGEVARAWRAGEMPLLTSLSWQSGALAGEYQYGVFSPFLTACNVLLFASGLPLTAIAALLVFVHLTVLSCGAYTLARSYRLPPPLALMVALVGSMNGWMIEWGVNWFPSMASFAWLPWAWWALKRSLERRGEWRWVVAAGAFIALLVTAGWPYTCVMIALVGGMLILSKGLEDRSWTTPLPVVLGGLIGVGLAAPAWLMLIEYSGATMRGQNSSSGALQTDFMVPLEGYLGAILPTLKAAWNIPWRPSEETGSLVMHVGLAPVVILVTAAIVLKSGLLRELPVDLLFLVVLFALSTLPSLGIFKWSFRWLPLLFVQLALVAGQAARLLADRDRPGAAGRYRYGAVGLTMVLLVIGYELLIAGTRPRTILWLWMGLVAITILWWLGERSPSWRRARPHLPWLVVISTSILTFGIVFRAFSFDLWHRPVEARAPELFDPAKTYLALYTTWEKIRYPGQRFFPGNEHMHANLRFVNGYSPMRPTGTSGLFGFNYIGALSTTPRSRQLGPYLRRMAVDGLVAWPYSLSREDIPWDQFELHASALGVTIFHRREGPTPRAQVVRNVFLAGSRGTRQRRADPLPELDLSGRSVAESRAVGYGAAELTILAEERLRVEVEVDARASDLPVLVCFARPWLPGYRATLDGENAQVMRLDLLQPAVEVPAGQKTRLELVYRPSSWVWGRLVSLATAAGLLVVFLYRGAIDRARHPVPFGHEPTS